MPAVYGDDIAVELEHIVFIVEVDEDLIDLSIKTPEFLDDTQWRKDEEARRAHQHEGGHDHMNRKEEKQGKEIFGSTVPEPPKAKSFGEEDMLQISHITCRKEKQIVVDREKMVLFRSSRPLLGQSVEHFADGRDAVYFGDDIEGAGGVEYEMWRGLQCVKLLEYSSDHAVPTVDDDVAVLFDGVFMDQLRLHDRIDLQGFMLYLFADGEEFQWYLPRGRHRLLLHKNIVEFFLFFLFLCILDLFDAASSIGVSQVTSAPVVVYTDIDLLDERFIVEF